MLTTIQTEVSSRIIANKLFRAGAFTLIERVEPRRPPMNAEAASGSARRTLKVPPTRWPPSPEAAVNATMSEEVPMAIRVGTRPSNTMAGSLKMPPETPIMPATKPAAAVTGISAGKRTEYCLLPS